MTKINGMEVTHPFLPDRSKQKWTTIGQIHVKNLEDGKVEVTNEAAGISEVGNTFEEALQAVNNKVYTEMQNGNLFLGREGY